MLNCYKGYWFDDANDDEVEQEGLADLDDQLIDPDENKDEKIFNAA